MSLNGDGVLEGYLAGYARVKTLLASGFGFRHAPDGDSDTPIYRECM